MIVKLQRPLYPDEFWPYSTERDPPWLVYPRDRRKQWLIPESELPAAVIAAMGGDPKGYFEAELGLPDHRRGELVIGDRVADEPW